MCMWAGKARREEGKTEGGQVPRNSQLSGRGGGAGSLWRREGMGSKGASSAGLGRGRDERSSLPWEAWEAGGSRGPGISEHMLCPGHRRSTCHLLSLSFEKVKKSATMSLGTSCHQSLRAEMSSGLGHHVSPRP